MINLLEAMWKVMTSVADSSVVQYLYFAITIILVLYAIFEPVFFKKRVKNIIKEEESHMKRLEKYKRKN